MRSRKRPSFTSTETSAPRVGSGSGFHFAEVQPRALQLDPALVHRLDGARECGRGAVRCAIVVYSCLPNTGRATNCADASPASPTPAPRVPPRPSASASSGRRPGRSWPRRRRRAGSSPPDCACSAARGAAGDRGSQLPQLEATYRSSRVRARLHQVPAELARLADLAAISTSRPRPIGHARPGIRPDSGCVTPCRSSGGARQAGSPWYAVR